MKSVEMLKVFVTQYSALMLEMAEKWENTPTPDHPTMPTQQVVGQIYRMIGQDVDGFITPLVEKIEAEAANGLHGVAH